MEVEAPQAAPRELETRGGESNAKAKGQQDAFVQLVSLKSERQLDGGMKCALKQITIFSAFLLALLPAKHF